MNTKLYAVTDANARPLSFFMTAGQISDYTGAAALLDSLPNTQWLSADRGYDVDWFRDAVQEKGIKPRIPGTNLVRSPSNTTSAVTSGAIASRSCSAGSKTGGACHAIRQMPHRLLLRHRSRRYGSILGTNPEPRQISNL